MTSPAQFRPGPPLALDSEAWTRDYNEVRAFGAKASTSRSAEQTEVARFREHSLPSIYYGLVNSVAQAPDRDVTQNARLFAAVSQAMDDAMISVFDAKYHFNFWRPWESAQRPHLRRSAQPRRAWFGAGRAWMKSCAKLQTRESSRGFTTARRPKSAPRWDA